MVIGGIKFNVVALKLAKFTLDKLVELYSKKMSKDEFEKLVELSKSENDESVDSFEKPKKKKKK